MQVFRVSREIDLKLPEFFSVVSSLLVQFLVSLHLSIKITEIDMKFNIYENAFFSIFFSSSFNCYILLFFFFFKSNS